MFADMARRTKGETLILVHRNELKQQHIELLSSLNISARVETYQTEYRRLGQHRTPKLLIVDEAHLSKSNTWSKVIEYYDTYTVGMSATPIRLDSRPLGDIYSALVTGVDVKWLIEHHRLAPYEYYAPTAVDTSSLRVVCGDYVASDLEKLMNERAIYGNVVDSYKRFALGEKSICYCVSVEHARKTAETFKTAGINAEVLSAKTPTAQRQRIMDAFRNGEITVLCNCTLLSEGISIDEISCTMLLRPTESVALGIQQMMRCMRYLPGKTAKIIDFVANYTRVGLPDDEREWSLGEPLKRKKQLNDNGDFYIRSCPECFMTFKTAPVCPFCGTEYPLHPREIKAREEIELQRITVEETARVEAEKKKARMEVGKCKTLDDLWAIAKERGYAPGWVWKMAKVKRISR